MRPTSRPDWWRLRRVQWPAATALLLVAAAFLVVARSDASRVVVYNETGSNITELVVSACGQSQVFHDVAEHESVRIKLGDGRGESDIEILTNGVALWRGDYIESHGGYRTVVRLCRDGEIETSTSVSWWQKLIHPNNASAL